MNKYLKRSLLSITALGIAIGGLASPPAAADSSHRLLVSTRGVPAIPLSAAGHWDLESAFLAHPDLNPAPDGTADVWYFMQSDRPRVGDYSLLPLFTTAWGEAQGLEGWLRGPDPGCPIDIPSLPTVIVNTTRQPLRVCGIAEPVPVHAAAVHPSFTKAVIGWRSPVSGAIGLSGTIEDFDARGGNGVKWSVRHETSQLAGGRIKNGGSDAIPTGLTTSVTEGEFIYLVIKANRNWEYDLTGLTFSIERL